MAVKKLVYFPEEEDKLRQLSKSVPRVKHKKIKQLIQDLKDTLESQLGAAIAAPQIGVLKRVTVVKFGQNDDEDEQPMLTLINPEIIEAGEPETGFDGCLSIPNIFTWNTPRPSWIRFKALGEDGEALEMRVEGMDARVIHHEIDHFDGILFLDRLTDPEELYTPIKGKEGKSKMVRLVDLPTMDSIP
jgi:peptide deformylase